LIAGGYLILDPQQIGLVIALGADIAVVISADDSSPDQGIITVQSPQFLNAEWKYKCTLEDMEKDLHVENLYLQSLIMLICSTPESSNDYVRITISYVLAYLSLYGVYQNALITIHADNDFYSQGSSLTFEQRKSLPPCNALNIPISETNKTGLGSSAALITALTACLLIFYGDIPVLSEEGRRIVHNLAQAAHCAAQGKVGSGFDIAAAVYGSCIYRRFDPSVLQHVLLDSQNYDFAFRCKLQNVVEQEWEMEITPFKLPEGLRIVMGDVAAGSATPSMVRSVLNWKAKSEGAEKVWNALGLSNKRLIEQFNNLNQFTREEIIAELREGMHTSRSTSNPRLFQALNQITEEFHV
jgi:phosphomevalonate kinase